MSNDFLYWFGFYVEYRLLCLARGLAAFTRWFVRVLGALLTAVLRPVALGCIQLRQALRRPKAWLGLVVPLAGVCPAGGIKWHRGGLCGQRAGL